MQNVEITLGDSSKPHNLIYSRIVGEDVATVTCQCGWQCTADTRTVKELGLKHLDRSAKVKSLLPE